MQSIHEIIAQIERILTQGARSNEAWEKLFGKGGLFKKGFKIVGTLSPSERARVGGSLHSLEKRARAIVKKIPEVDKPSSAIPHFDPTLPGTVQLFGHAHPLMVVAQDMMDFFQRLNFEVAFVNEIEKSQVNFDMLNFTKDHPAKEGHATIWVNRDKELLLRTHTSTIQIYAMTKRKPPLKVITVGRVYRFEAEDATHASVFHQVDGFVVGPSVAMSQLKWTLEAMLHELFGAGLGVRFRPSFFPFTEPSSEVDLECVHCAGKGCAICKYSGWLEILGAGMIHPNVLRNVGYDPNRVSGFAFGIGLERIAMIRYGIDDVRTFLTTDPYVLEQFSGI